MKPLDDNLRDLLAGRYALGVMQAGARRRFESWLRYDQGLRRLTRRWERQLDGLNQNLTPVSPPARVWQRLEQRISPAHTASKDTPVQGVHLSNGWQGWRSFALFASLVAVMLGGWIVYPHKPHRAVPPPINLAVLSGDTGAMYVMCSDPVSHKAAFEVLAKAAIPDDKDAELWLLPANGAPRSMGLLPREGRMVKTVRAEILAQFAGAKGLAVSVEPKGGSPTGGPTGPIPYQGKLMNFWSRPASATATLAYTSPMPVLDSPSRLRQTSASSHARTGGVASASFVASRHATTYPVVSDKSSNSFPSTVPLQTILRLQQILRNSPTKTGGEI